MQRKKRVEEFVLYQWNKAKNEKQDIHITAEMTAAALNIWRSDASRDLNSLVKDGILQKTDTYPVCFFPKEKKISDFSDKQKTFEPFESIIG